MGCYYAGETVGVLVPNGALQLCRTQESSPKRKKTAFETFFRFLVNAIAHAQSLPALLGNCIVSRGKWGTIFVSFSFLCEQTSTSSMTLVQTARMAVTPTPPVRIMVERWFARVTKGFLATDTCAKVRADKDFAKANSRPAHQNEIPQ